MVILIFIFTLLFAIINAKDSTISSTILPNGYRDEINYSSILNNLTDNTYNSFVPPELRNGKATNVFISIGIKFIGGLSDKSNTYSLLVDLNEEWQDHRLNLLSSFPEHGILLSQEHIAQLWLPRLAFDRAHSITRQGELEGVYVTRHKWIHRKTRILFTLGCAMNFAVFPMDTQHCLFSIRNMNDMDHVVRLNWISQLSKNVKKIDIVRNDQIKDSSFELFKADTIATPFRNPNGDFTSLECQFTFKRKLTFSMATLYLPAAMNVIVSWATFWFSVEAIVARTALGIQSVLSIVTQISAAVSFSTFSALDVWLFACQLFVCLAVVELIIAILMSKFATEWHIGFMYSSDILLDEDIGEDVLNTEDTEKLAEVQQKLKEKKKGQVLTVDAASRILFPSLFIMFAAFYWAVLIYYQHQVATREFSVKSLNISSL